MSAMYGNHWLSLWPSHIHPHSAIFYRLNRDWDPFVNKCMRAGVIEYVFVVFQPWRSFSLNFIFSSYATRFALNTANFRTKRFHLMHKIQNFPLEIHFISSIEHHLSSSASSSFLQILKRENKNSVVAISHQKNGGKLFCLETNQTKNLKLFWFNWIESDFSDCFYTWNKAFPYSFVWSNLLFK